MACRAIDRRRLRRPIFVSSFAGDRLLADAAHASTSCYRWAADGCRAIDRCRLRSRFFSCHLLTPTGVLPGISP
jgi:hypothetical protein